MRHNISSFLALFRRPLGALEKGSFSTLWIMSHWTICTTTTHILGEHLRAFESRGIESLMEAFNAKRATITAHLMMLRSEKMQVKAA